jgi:hypothetical protein
MSMKDRNNWTSIFMKATIVQMILASALTIYLLVGIIGPLRLLSFVISYNASDAPFAGTWFNFGYFTYLIGVLAIGMMAMIYRHFEHALHIGYESDKSLSSAKLCIHERRDNNCDLAYDDSWIYRWSRSDVICMGK